MKAAIAGSLRPISRAVFLVRLAKEAANGWGSNAFVVSEEGSLVCLAKLTSNFLRMDWAGVPYSDGTVAYGLQTTGTAAWGPNADAVGIPRDSFVWGRCSENGRWVFVGDSPRSSLSPAGVGRIRVAGNDGVGVCGSTVGVRVQFRRGSRWMCGRSLRVANRGRYLGDVIWRVYGVGRPGGSLLRRS